jgi:predicted component of type VI protein secretion system
LSLSLHYSQLSSTKEDFHLVMRSGPSVGKVFPLEKGEMLIGRDLNNDVTINDPEISRRHARLYAQGSTYVLEDLGSTNGTFVGGQRLTGAYPLRIGEVITFGERITVVFEMVQPETDATVVAAVPRQAPVTPIQAPVQPPVQAPVQPAYQPPAQVPAQPVYQAPPAPIQQAYQAPAYQSQAPLPPQPVYAGQVPYVEELEPPKPKKRTTLILLLILAAVLFLACICVVVLLWNAPIEFWCQFPVWGTGACP